MYRSICAVCRGTQNSGGANQVRSRSTIYDVAELAGVSAKTVSRVINNSSLVAPDTRRKVLAAIAELDFHPDSAAKGLRQRRRKSVGLVIPYGSDFVFQDPGHVGTDKRRP
jgi:hypothetical protein